MNKIQRVGHPVVGSEKDPWQRWTRVTYLNMATRAYPASCGSDAAGLAWTYSTISPTFPTDVKARKEP